MLDHVAQRCETSVVIEAALLVRPESFEWCGSIAFVGRAFRLEVVNADLFRRMHVPARLCEDWRHVTRRTLRLPIEHCRTACCCRRIKTSRRRRRCWNCELIKLQCRKLSRGQVGIAAHVTKTFARCDRKLHRIVKTRIIKRALPVHFQIGYERVPMRYRTPPGPGVKVDAGQSKRGREQCRR